MKNRFITLVRHAKSSWKIAGQTDHDRTLSCRGERDAPIMANRLAERQCIPDLILCSSAVRTLQTARVLMDAFNLGKDILRVERRLYLCSPETLLELLASVEDGPEHIMIIGHNPGLEQLSTLMSPRCTPQMPTLGVRHFSCLSFHHLPLGKQFQQAEVEPESVTEQKVELVFEDFPKNDQ
ncbi:MAG: phosphohistidine phosphatase [Granulosicoccus sp.]|jgi:phosphohistidine phosphatase